MIIKIKDQRRVVTEPSHIFELLNAYFKTVDKIDRDKEHFFVLHLDTRHKIKIVEIVSIGILNASIVHPREVFTRAVRERSAQLILAHNHPSGEIEPSNEDIEVTKRLIEAGKILQIEVLDHLIYTSTGFYSFKREGII